MATILQFPADRVQARVTPSQRRVLTPDERVQRLVEWLERTYAGRDTEPVGGLGGQLARKLDETRPE